MALFGQKLSFLPRVESFISYFFKENVGNNLIYSSVFPGGVKISKAFSIQNLVPVKDEMTISPHFWTPLVVTGLVVSGQSLVNWALIPPKDEN